ncbi:MAG: nucleoside-diphosphate sugar epimerase/dehydratase [Bacteroidota bacterium]
MFPKTNTPRWIIILLDLGLSAVSLFIAYVIRFDLKADKQLWVSEWEILSKSILVFFVVRFATFYFLKIHKGIVRHTSTVDFRRLFIAVSISSSIFLVLGIFRYYFYDGYFLFPSSVLIMEYLICFFLMTVARFAVKLWYLESVKNKEEHVRILLYGAGISGLIAKRTIERDIRLNYKIIGFIDDNKKIVGTRLEGIPVYHTSSLEKLLKEEKITQVIIAIQDPEEENRGNVVRACLEAGVEIRKVPSVKSWINGEFSTKQISKVRIEDLLGRKPIVLNQQKLAAELTGKVVLVTGAAGSIGGGLVLQIAEYKPKLLVLLDQAESPLYELQFEMRQLFPDCPIEVVIGDIRNKERMAKLFEAFRPSWVFHAAAYKHVPMMEDNPSEAVLTNVKGTKHLVDLAQQYEVFKFVMISTDKAVNPTNVMGASKRIAEIIAQDSNQHGKTQFITTRFGNVLGSNGSVIPLFKRQIEQGGPITVTDERVTRFFMTIPEACQLVLEAGVMGNGGEIFVFDMGESVKIIDLAKNMIRLSGLELGKDIEIQFTGLRPGEKLYEELLNAAENALPTHHPKILKAKIRESDTDQITQIETLIQAVSATPNMEVVQAMKHIVPEFISNNSEFSVLDNNDPT